MIHVTCFKCGWKYTLDEEVLAEQVVQAGNPDTRYYVARCPNCRSGNKVSLKKLRGIIKAKWEEREKEEQRGA